MTETQKNAPFYRVTYKPRSGSSAQSKHCLKTFIVDSLIARPISLTQTRLATRQGSARNDFVIGLALPR
jgi:hypothetical protein